VGAPDRVRVHEQLRQAAQARRTDLQHRQAAQHRQHAALAIVQRQPGHRGDALAVQEQRGECAHAGAARRIQRAQPRDRLDGQQPDGFRDLGR